MTQHRLMATRKYEENYRERNWFHISWYVQLELEEYKKEKMRIKERENNEDRHNTN